MTYTIDTAALTLALEDADTRLQRAEEHHARTVCTGIAATVRDILTNHNPAALFDAAHLRLIQLPNETLITTDGTYWTTTGTQHRIPTDTNELLAHLIAHLNNANRGGWEPLCHEEQTPLNDGPATYRLDLAQAAQLPTDIHHSPHTNQIRAHLTAAPTRPWTVDELSTTRNGGNTTPDDPNAIHTDFLIHDADRNQIAELSLNHAPDESNNPAEDIAATRATAHLIANAPAYLQYLLGHLDHASGGEDAHALNLRGNCARCNTPLYTTTPSATPTALDGATHCPPTHNVLRGQLVAARHILPT